MCIVDYKKPIKIFVGRNKKKQYVGPSQIKRNNLLTLMMGY